MRSGASTLLLVVLLVAAAGCAQQLTAPPAPEVAGPARAAAPVLENRVPSGRVVAAQPWTVDVWWQDHPEDVGAADLAPLWTLPLYRTDPLGRPVPGLAAGARVAEAADGWTVEVDLARGNWSDGTPVTAADVVATAEALAERRPARWAAFRAAVAVDDRTVHLRFDRPFAGWVGLLSEPPGVLPAHVLSESGLDGYADELPVTGGWFRPTARQEGLRTTFAAWPESPLGPPRLAEVEVLVVPSHEVALGLLADEAVDLVLGHVAIDPATRRAAVDGVIGAATFGGTRVELVWDPTGRADLQVRRAAARLLDPGPFVQGLLRDVGRLPGGVLPVLAPIERPDDSAASGAVALQVPRTVEGLGLLARRVQADLAGAGVQAALVRVDPPQDLEPPLPVDGRLRLVRVRPDRSAAALLAELGLDAAPGTAADAEGTEALDPTGSRIPPTGAHEAVAAVLSDDPLVMPVAEVAVTHVWHPDRVTGVAPSGWPGVGFWNVGEWAVPSS